MKRRIGLAVACVAMMVGAGQARGALVSVDPDAFSAGTNISNAFAGITLSTQGSGWASPSGAVFSLDPSTQAAEPFNASTGSLSFGSDDRSYPHLFMNPGFLQLRVDFASATNEVHIDYISNDNADTGLMRAFNSSNVLLGSYTTGSLAASQFETMSYTSGSADIAYILAGGDSSSSSGGLDNLQYGSTVPEPASLVVWSLLGVAGIAIGCRRRRRAA